MTGYKDVTPIAFETNQIRKAVAHVDAQLLNISYAELGEVGFFDLVVCSNVIDQCENPRNLAATLQKHVAPGGVLAVSCTYMWNDRRVPAGDELITNIRDLFPKTWGVFGETNLEFRCRRYERHWLTFLSHVLVMQRPLPDRE